MKHILFFLLLTIGTVLSLSAKEIIIENPPFSATNTQSLEIEKIVLDKEKTVIYFTGYHRPGWWLKFSSGTYIRANGEKLLVQSADGISLDKEEPTNSEGKLPFSLTFPPISSKTKQIDFIEDDCETCFKIWGIELKSKKLTNREFKPIKDDHIDPNDNSTLPANSFHAGNAIIKGKLYGYQPEMKKEVEIYVNNVVIGNQEEYATKVDNEGRFELKVPVVSTTQILFRINHLINNWVMVSPEKETLIHIDLQQKAMAESRSRIDKAPDSQWIYFQGANADINTQYFSMISKSIEKEFDYTHAINNIAEMSAEEYKTHIFGLQERAIQSLKEKKPIRKVLELGEREIKYRSLYYLMMGDHFLESAYRKKHNKKRGEEIPDYKKPVFDEQYYSFLKDADINNPASLYLSEYSSVVNNCKFIIYRFHKDGSITYNSNEIFPELRKYVDLTPEETKFVEIAIESNKNPQLLEGDSLTLSFMQRVSENFFKKYKEELDNLHTVIQLENTKSILANILGTNQGILFDLVSAQTYASKLEEFTPLNALALKRIEVLENPFFFTYLTKLNNDLLAQIELNKTKKGYNVYELPETEEDKILHEIVKPFEGKVIFIDFWGTWCAPCRSAMKDFEPTKEQFKGHIFVRRV